MKTKEFIDLVNDSSFFHAKLNPDKTQIIFNYWEYDSDRFTKKPNIQIILPIVKSFQGTKIKTTNTGFSDFDLSQLSNLFTLIFWFLRGQNKSNI